MRTMQRFLARLRSDRGNVGVLMALFIMVAVGSLAMTWNTVQISKEKMRLQTAADSAALSACVWQARGMNAVQNINDEMYIMLSLATKLLLVATPIQTLGVSLWSSRFAPFVGPVFSAFAIGAFGVALLLGGSSAWMVALCKYLLSPLETFYAKISPFLGFWGAQQLAAKNGATRLLTATSANTDKLGETFGNVGIFTIGTSVPTSELLTLPLEKLSGTLSKPWKHSNTVAKIKQLIEKGKKKTTFGAGETDAMDTWEVVDKNDLANSQEINIEKEPVSEEEKAARKNIWSSNLLVRNLVLAEKPDRFRRPVVDTSRLTAEAHERCRRTIDRELALWKLYAARVDHESAASLMPAITHFRLALTTASSIREERPLLESEDFRLYQRCLRMRRAELRDWFVLYDKYVATGDDKAALKQAEFIAKHATLEEEALNRRCATEAQAALKAKLQSNQN